MLSIVYYNILDSSISKYSTMNIFNSDVDKYYAAKKTHGISHSSTNK
jgi:hypothetical protein